MTDVFLPALAEMPIGQWHRSEPTSFKRYLQLHGLPEERRTPEYISVDFQEQLAPSLRETGVMVLRLGRATDGPGTQFSLVSSPGRLDDFFLHDDHVFGTAQPKRFEPETPGEVLKVYTVFGRLTETSMVALAFTSGLMGCALGLDRPVPVWAPATGASTYTFPLRLHSALPQVDMHRSGQVEVDAAFIGYRKGRPHLFVVEAKSDDTYRTLAKHKLMYPVLGLAGTVDAELPIVPIYLKMRGELGAVSYHIVECSCPDPRRREIGLNELDSVDHQYWRLCLPE